MPVIAHQILCIGVNISMITAPTIIMTTYAVTKNTIIPTKIDTMKGISGIRIAPSMISPIDAKIVAICL